MIISRIAGLFALLSLLLAVYGGSHLFPALFRSIVVFVVTFIVMFVVQITMIYAYRKAKEAEEREIIEKDVPENVKMDSTS
jgi:hypothetical protein